MRRLILLLLLVSTASTLASGAVPCSALSVSPDCYVAVRPGPARDVFGLIDTAGIEASGLEASESAGELLLTTVLVEQELTWRELVAVDRDPTSVRAKRESYFPADVDPEATRAQFAAMMEESEQSAMVAALTELGFDLQPDGVTVQGVLEDGPSAGVLTAGDVIVGAEGTVIAEADTLGEVVGALAPGDQLVLEVEVEGVGTEQRTVTLGEHPDDPSRGFAGLFLVTRVHIPVDLDIDAGTIGGPSAGMMFALTIVDLLTPEDLTGGAVVAGTGEIGLDGRVGPIGGIQQKVAGATRREEGPSATVFLVPRDNFEEALGASVGGSVTLVPIDTLRDAIAALEAVRAGELPADAVQLEPAA